MPFTRSGRGYTKPLPGAQINWGAPIAQGLQIAIPANEGFGRALLDVVSGLLWTANDPASSNFRWEGSRFGVTFRNANPASTWVNAPRSPLHHITTRFSFAFRVKMDSVTSDQIIYNGGTFGGIVVRVSAASKIELLYFGSPAGASTTSLAADTYFSAGVSYDGSVVRFYLDGRPDGSASVSLSFSNGGTPALGFHNLAHLYAWDRVLSDQEFARLHAEPYAIFGGQRLLNGDPSISGAGAIASTVAFGTAVVTGALSPTGIASTAAIGTPVVDASLYNVGGIASTLAIGTPVIAALSISGSGIASTLAFGTANIQLPVSISGNGIASTAAFGSPVVLLETTRAFTIFIGGVDRTKYIADPSIDITHQLGSRGSCGFRIIPEIVGNSVLSSYTPAMYDEVLIHHNSSGYRLFLGEVESIAKTIPSGGLAGGGYFELDIRCTDYGVVLDRRAMAKWYTIFLGSYVPIIARDVVDEFLDGTGITYDGVIPPTGEYIGEQLANWVYVGDFLRQICEEANLVFRVDNYKALRFIDRAVGTGAAPFSITQNDGNWRSLTNTRTRGKFANRVIARNSQDITALWTDTAELNGSGIYATTYPQSVKPIILVDDVEQIVAEASALGSTPGWTWYYMQDGMGVFTATDPGSGDLVIRYPSKVSHVAIAEDAASIATYGQWDHIEEVKDITDPDALQQHAESILSVLGTIPENLDIETDKAGLEPGQLLTVNANGVSGDYLIEQTSIREHYNSMPRWNVVASNAPQRNGAGTDFFRRMIARQRHAIDRIDSSIAFVLAETIEGSTNPGLTVGVKNAMRVARKNGYAKLCRLWFNSASSTPTTSTIEIDLLQNGVSIFGGTYKMLFPAQSTTVQTNFFFRSEPLAIEAGDVFTIQVIRADSTATDGWIELQVQG